MTRESETDKSAAGIDGVFIAVVSLSLVLAAAGFVKYGNPVRVYDYLFEGGVGLELFITFVYISGAALCFCFFTYNIFTDKYK